MSRGESFLMLGGAGLVGKQIARRVAHDLDPCKIVIVSLFQPEVEAALEDLRDEYKSQPIEWLGEWGDVFVQGDFSLKPREALLNTSDYRDSLYDDLFGNVQTAYKRSHLAQLILKHRPDVIVDSINTATAISYQDIDRASAIARRQVDDLLADISGGDITSAAGRHDTVEKAFETLVISQALPQLVRHIQILHLAMREAGTRLYLKVGTTGTGGMGLNIPYTHSEDKPSAKLMTKTAVAFAHTGLLFLMARTPGGPVVKEIKPGAMIGYADVANRAIVNKAKGVPAYLYEFKSEALGERLVLRQNDGYQQVGELTLPVVDTGENGLFTKGEFEAITSLRQMEFVTPEEIARESMLEIKGSNTGRDVIAAVDGAVMNPTYRAGYLRQQVLADMERLEKASGTHSVALGQLGPPEISKLLWEAELLKIEYGNFADMLGHKPETIAQKVHKRLSDDSALCQLITSIGVPVLTPDGKCLLRGPFIRIPEIKDDEIDIAITPEAIDHWADKGWVDLRPANFARWQTRFNTIQNSRQRIRGKGSAAIIREAYVFDDIRIGEIVGWIFNNEEGGYRIK